jgi:hypothetical protein
MRTAHLNYTKDCPCGFKMRGNGWRAHARNCRDFLTTKGYPLAEADRQALRDTGFTHDEIAAATRRLGEVRAAELPAPGWSWRAYGQRMNAVLVELGYAECTDET